MQKKPNWLCTPKQVKQRMDAVKRYSFQQGMKPPYFLFTNGCFDICHAGHVTMLQYAKEVLPKGINRNVFIIVALNTDESVSKIKGPNRPVFNLRDRSKVVHTLECVDVVTYFEEETPLNVIQFLKPDILMKGGDYELEEVVGAAEMKANGGSVIIFPLLEGLSTTNFYERMQNA